MTRGQWQHNQRVDCLVIGGGPAGLTVALYLARFRLTVQGCRPGCGAGRIDPADEELPGLPRV